MCLKSRKIARRARRGLDCCGCCRCLTGPPADPRPSRCRTGIVGPLSSHNKDTFTRPWPHPTKAIGCGTPRGSGARPGHALHACSALGAGTLWRSTHLQRAQGGSDFGLDRLVALCPRCHARIDAPYVRGRLVITPLGAGRFTVEVTRGADMGDPSVMPNHRPATPESSIAAGLVELKLPRGTATDGQKLRSTVALFGQKGASGRLVRQPDDSRERSVRSGGRGGGRGRTPRPRVPQVCAQLPLRGPARVGIQYRLSCCRGVIGGLLPRR